MKITIQPTDARFLRKTLPCRVWRGITEDGTEVAVHVLEVRLAPGARSPGLAKDPELISSGRPDGGTRYV